MYRLLLKPAARKQLQKVPRNQQVRISHALEYIAEEPFSGKKLTGKHQGQYSVRVWPYRIIYIVHKKEILVIVLNIGHRQGIY